MWRRYWRPTNGVNTVLQLNLQPVLLLSIVVWHRFLYHHLKSDWVACVAIHGCSQIHLGIYTWDQYGHYQCSLLWCLKSTCFRRKLRHLLYTLPHTIDLWVLVVCISIYSRIKSNSKDVPCLMSRHLQTWRLLEASWMNQMMTLHWSICKSDMTEGLAGFTEGLVLWFGRAKYFTLPKLGMGSTLDVEKYLARWQCFLCSRYPIVCTLIMYWLALPCLLGRVLIPCKLMDSCHGAA